MALSSPKGMTKVNKIVAWLTQADNLYYNDPINAIKDNEYDRVFDRLKKLDPKNEYFNKVGSKPNVGIKLKEKLVNPMGSLVKLKPDTVSKWLEKHPKGTEYTVTPKLDGISGKIVYQDGAYNKAFKRGDGITGVLISERAKYITGVPRSLRSNMLGRLEVNGEFVIFKKVFKKKYKGKIIFPGQTEPYATARNFVGGVLNRLELTKLDKEVLKDIIFVTFGVNYSLEYPAFKTKAGEIMWLQSEGMTTVIHPAPITENTAALLRQHPQWSTKIIPQKKGEPLRGWYHIGQHNLKPDYFRAFLLQIREQFDVQMDGIVIEVNNAEYRKKLGTEKNSINPRYARSIKPTTDEQVMVLGNVSHIAWRYTSRRVYKPTVVLRNPIDFDGVEVTHMTGHNAEWVRSRGIDSGAVLKVIRSGDVIPYINGVQETSLPVYIPKRCEYCRSKLEWTDVDIHCPNKKCVGWQIERTREFFTRVGENGVENLGDGTLDVLIAHGFNTLPKILKMKPSHLVNLPGFGERKAKIVVESIHAKTDRIELPTLMHSSGLFANERSGLGKIKLAAITEFLGNKRILTASDKDFNIRTELLKVPGISDTGSNMFAVGLRPFRAFYQDIKDLVNIMKPPKSGEGPLSGVIAVFTSFRDAELESIITENGGKIGGAVTKATTVLFAADTGTSKATKAREYGITVVSADKAHDYINELMGK